MKGNTFVEEISYLLLLFRFLGWLPARVDPETGLVALKKDPLHFLYSFLVVLTFFSANFVTVYFTISVIIIYLCALINFAVCILLLQSALRSKDVFPVVTYAQIIGSLAASLIPIFFLLQSSTAVQFCNSMLKFQVCISFHWSLFLIC